MWLVSCGTDLKLHNCTNYDIVNTYRPADSTGQIRSISWCKDGSWLALVPTRGNAEIIRTKDDVRLLQSILGIPYPTTAVFQKTTKKHVAMSTVNNEVLVYDIKARSIKKQFPNAGATGSVLMMDWSVKDTHLAAGDTEGQVTIYSNTTNQKINVFTLPNSKSISVVRFHSTQRAILGTASDEGVVVVWDINSANKKLSLQSHKAPATDLVFSSQNRNLMVSVGLDRTFQCYDVNAGEVALSVLVDHPLSTIDMASDGYTIAVGSTRGNIYIYDLREYQKPMNIIAAHSGEVKKVLYQPITLESNSESINLTEDKPLDTIDQGVEVRNNIASDLFGLNLIPEFTSQQNNNEIEQMDQDQDMDVKGKSASAAGDSFFNYLETCDNGKRDSVGSFTKEKSEMSNLGISDGVKKWLDSKHQLQQQQPQQSPNEVPSTQNLYDSVHGKLSDVIPTISSQMSSSTPRQLLSNHLVSNLVSQQIGNSNISPIPVMGAGPQFLTTEELKSVVNEVVHEQMDDLMDALSRQFINLQLSITKQFVNQEMQMGKIQNCLQISPNKSHLSIQNQQLQQENDFLRKKINELMKQK